MKPAIALLAAPALVAGQGFKIPTLDEAKGWVDQAQQFLLSVSSAPKAAASAKVADIAVTPLTWSDWKATLRHSGEVKTDNAPEPWMVYITGGNFTCGGHCDQADRAWEESIPLLLADPDCPNLASIDCESEEMLCGAWAAVSPSIWMYRVPQAQPDQSRANTPLTIHLLNRTTVATSDVTDIVSKKLYLEETPYEGALHPIDGWIAQNGLTEPMAMSLYYFSKIPSWLFMIGLSLFSRSFVNKRMPRPAPRAQ